MAREPREFDVVVWGATGFTGRLVAEYLARRAAGGGFRWAVAARNRERLAGVMDALAADLPDAAGVAQLIADSGDAVSLRALAARTRVVISTVGPYAWYGTELVAACAETGTDYCDLSGEVQWIRAMIERFDAPARASGARLVHCCGFDSVPFDLGVWYTQQQMHARHGVFCREIEGVVRRIDGSFSGGTFASMLNFVAEAARDPALRRMAADPFALLPALARRPPRVPARPAVHRIPELGGWTAPFVMAAVNTRIVRRSNALLGWPWGEDFVYEETLWTGRGTGGQLRATAVALGMGAFMGTAAFAPTRALLKKLLPDPGEGPDAEARRRGGYEIAFIGRHPRDAGRHLQVTVRGEGDPGYASTSRMIAECALALAQDGIEAPGGSGTPAAVLGEHLLARLTRHAGLSFSVEDAAGRG